MTRNPADDAYRALFRFIKESPQDFRALVDMCLANAAGHTIQTVDATDNLGVMPPILKVYWQVPNVEGLSESLPDSMDLTIPSGKSFTINLVHRPQAMPATGADIEAALTITGQAMKPHRVHPYGFDVQGATTEIIAGPPACLRMLYRVITENLDLVQKLPDQVLMDTPDGRTVIVPVKHAIDVLISPQAKAALS